MKTYIRRQQHNKFKHQDIKQKEPPQIVVYDNMRGKVTGNTTMR